MKHSSAGALSFTGGLWLAARVMLPLAGAHAAETQAVLHDFAGAPDGAGPNSGLLLSASGTLYGTTSSGGSGCSAGCGTVFELIPPAKGKSAWTETILYDFTGGADGAHPVALLVADSAGNLYGTTSTAGEAGCGCGTVFELTRPAAGATAWSLTVLHSFLGAPDGATPAAGLAFDKSGNLYGTTETGGAYGDTEFGNGTVFKLTKPAGAGAWPETILHSFNASKTDGGSPTGELTLDASGNLYGTTDYGGSGIEPISGIVGSGTVFELTKPAAGTAWKSTILHSFSNDLLDGAIPPGRLVFDAAGNLYGVTSIGGHLEDGTIFKLSPPSRAGKSWKHKILYNFNGTTGAYPLHGLALSGGILYGTASHGGSSAACGSNGCGTVFDLNPNSRKLTVLHSFTGLNGDGATPQCDVVLDAADNVYATTSGGGTLANGTALRLSP
jgi:uncharacterized repeat protein (TIGR03803 family)